MLRSLLERYGLGFADPELEAAFKDEYALRHIPIYQAVILVAGFATYAFVPWDRAIDPENWRFGQAIRLYVMIPVLWATGALLWIRAVRPYFEWLIAISGIVSVVSLAAIYMHLQRGFDFGAVGPIIVGVWVFSIFQIRFAFALAFLVGSSAAFFGIQAFLASAGPETLIVNLLGVAGAGLSGLWAATMRERTRREQFMTVRALGEARGRIEELLHSMLPSDIVRRIQAGEQVIADTHGEVSIIFADLVGFTPLSTRLTPVQLVDLLNRLFSRFDARAEEFGIEKIKTIGDAYMCAGGIPHANDSNPVDAVLAGLAMQRFIQQRLKEKQITGTKYWNCRLGISTGEVIAGIIGKHKFAYDIWSDTVNIASRMESSGEPGRVNISASTYEEVKDFFNCTPRGKVEAKGKGEIDMYFVDGIKPELSRDGRGIEPNEAFRERLQRL